MPALAVGLASAVVSELQASNAAAGPAGLTSRRPLRSLFARTAAAIAIALLAYDVFSHAVLGHYIVYPLAQRSTDDLAALMIVSARAWNEAPLSARTAVREALFREHGFWVADRPAPLPEAEYEPYLMLLGKALQRRTGTHPQFYAEPEVRRYWVDVPSASGSVRMGLPADRVSMHPLHVVLILLALGALLTFGTALVYVRRLTRPLGRLSNAARRIGRGEFPDALPLTGPGEIAELTDAFNRMGLQVKELLASRTTMLAGISHDLRTPLARMQFAVEMLPAQSDPKLISGLQRDLAEMNQLITRFLELSRGLKDEECTDVNLGSVLTELVEDVRRVGGECEWSPKENCRLFVRPTALRRILANLLDNAVRYGGGAAVHVTHACLPAHCVVRIADRGPGIPTDEREAVFRPFYRLEQSRSAFGGGTGLGLAIARQLADGNGWRIRLSAREGGGTEAELILPRTCSKRAILPAGRSTQSV